MAVGCQRDSNPPPLDPKASVTIELTGLRSCLEPGKVPYKPLNYCVGRHSVKRHATIDVRCQLFDQLFEWNAATVRLYGMYFELLPDMVLVDESFCQEYPSVME